MVYVAKKLKCCFPKKTFNVSRRQVTLRKNFNAAIGKDTLNCETGKATAFSMMQRNGDAKLTGSGPGDAAYIP